MATKSMLNAAIEGLNKNLKQKIASENTLTFARSQVKIRRDALNVQLDEHRKQLAQINNNINAILGALQDVDFWEGKLNEQIIEDTAVLEQLQGQV